LSLYRVHFKWKEREVQLSARSLDLTHPYFVSIKDLVFSDRKKLIINPAEDEITKAFGTAKHLMIPFQTVGLIEELDEKQESARVRQFTLVDGREAAGSEGPGRPAGPDAEAPSISDLSSESDAQPEVDLPPEEETEDSRG
jgi:hypothetical protein